MPGGFFTFRIVDRIIIQFDLPAGCRKHFGRHYPDKPANLAFAWVMIARVFLSLSKTEFIPCGSHGGSPK
jgi:hypothetical protein